MVGVRAAGGLRGDDGCRRAPVANQARPESSTPWRVAPGWALIWERAWPPLAWTGALVALFLAASWFGLWFAAPRFARIGGLALFALALFATLAPLARLRRPSRAQTLARLDGDAPDPHRPASDFDDRLANGMGDETTNALWALHRARLARRVDRLSLAPPTPGMAKRDPRALRFAAVLLALAAGWLAGSEHYARVAAAFDWRGASASAAPARVDAWIDPPAYTNKPPLLLKVVGQEKPESVVAPENSVLIVRADPRLVETRIEGALTASTPDAPKPAAGAPSERRFVIHGDGKFTLLQGGSPLAAFAISATPSGKPTIALVDPPQSNLTGSLTLHYSIADAYGVAGAQAQFALPNAAGAGPKHSLVEAPKLGLPLPPGNGVGEARTTSDLSEHPWAGAKVVMTLQATDVAGESGAERAGHADAAAAAFFQAARQGAGRTAARADPRSRPQSFASGEGARRTDDRAGGVRHGPGRISRPADREVHARRRAHRQGPGGGRRPAVGDGAADRGRRRFAGVARAARRRTETARGAAARRVRRGDQSADEGAAREGRRIHARARAAKSQRRPGRCSAGRPGPRIHARPDGGHCAERRA